MPTWLWLSLAVDSVRDGVKIELSLSIALYSLLQQMWELLPDVESKRKIYHTLSRIPAINNLLPLHKRTTLLVMGLMVYLANAMHPLCKI